MRNFPNWIIKKFPRFPQIQKISLDGWSRRSRHFAGLRGPGRGVSKHRKSSFSSNDGLLFVLWIRFIISFLWLNEKVRESIHYFIALSLICLAAACKDFYIATYLRMYRIFLSICCCRFKNTI